MRRRPKGLGTIIEEGAGFALRIGRGPSATYESGFRTRGEAEARAALIRAEKIHRRLGVAADPRLTPTLGELAVPWLERRLLTHRAGKEDRCRWNSHLGPHFGHLRPTEVDVDAIKAFAEAKLREGLAGGTIRVCVATLSSLYQDHRKLAPTNPARGLPPDVMRLMRSHDPKTTPFVERLDDVRRIYLSLLDDEPVVATGYALGALAGLRPGEAFGLRWPQVDLARRRIHILETVTGDTKDHDSRIVPILDGLHPVLEAWKLKTGGQGLVCPPLRKDGGKVDKSTRGDALRRALKALELARPGFGVPSKALPLAKQDLWYWCTRHTFASHWVLQGRSIEKLSKVLGHYSVEITWKHYVHLRPDLFVDEERSALPVDLTPSTASVATIAQDSADGRRGPPVSPQKHKKVPERAL